MSQWTIELEVKTDFDGRENADLDLLLPIYCFKMIVSSYTGTQNYHKDNTFLMMYLKTLYLKYLFMLFAKYGRPRLNSDMILDDVFYSCGVPL